MADELDDELNSRSKIAQLVDEMNKKLDDQARKRQIINDLGTEAQKQAQESESLQTKLNTLSSAQKDIMDEMVVALRNGNTEALILGQTELTRLKTQMTALQAQEAYNQKIKELTAPLDKWKNTVKDIKEIAHKTITDTRVAIAILGTAALNAAMNFKHWAADMGTTAGQAAQLGVETGKAYASTLLYGVSLEKSAKITEALVQETGNLGLVTSDIIGNAAMISTKFGLAEGEAAKLTLQLKSIEASTGQTVKDSTATIKALATQAGVAPGAVMKDIANSGKDFALYSNGSVEGLAKAAIEAKKLGLSLNEAAQISNNLLDIDKSLEAELEASALLGRQINFNKARELALTGDVEGASKAVLEQLGSIDEFNKLNVYQKQALAEAAGLEVEQLQKNLTLQAEAAKTDQMRTGFFGKMLDYGLGIAATGKNWASSFFQNAPQLAAMAGLLGKIVNLQKIGNFLSGVANKLGLTRIANLIKEKVIKQTTETTPPVPKPGGGGGIGKIFSGLGKNMGAILKGAAAMAIIAGAMFIFAKAAQEFGPGIDWAGVAMGAGTLIVLGTAAAIMGNLSANIITGALAMGILGAALIPAAFAFYLLKDVPLDNIIALSVALPLLALAAAGLGFLFPFIALGAGALALVGAAVMPFALSMSYLNGVDVTGTVESLTTLVGLAPGMMALSTALLLSVPGLLGFSVGLGALALGLAVLTPFLPTLKALHEMGMVGTANVTTGGGGGGETTKEGGGETNKAMLDKLDMLIEAVKSGQNIYIDGQRIAQVVASNTRGFEKIGSV